MFSNAWKAPNSWKRKSSIPILFVVLVTNFTLKAICIPIYRPCSVLQKNLSIRFLDLELRWRETFEPKVVTTLLHHPVKGVAQEICLNN
jgi:hypothetical protein